MERCDLSNSTENDSYHAPHPGFGNRETCRVDRLSKNELLSESGEWLMTQRNIIVSLSLGPYLVNDHRSARVQRLKQFAIYAWTTHYRTPGFMTEAIGGKPTAAGRTCDQSKREELNKEGTT